MDQSKIGFFIAECRKKKKLTQMQLAEKLGITDRAISKWENGKSLPDASIMLDLCAELGISVNDLLSGEVVTVENYNENLEKNLLDMIHQKEEADKRLLSMEIVIGVLGGVFLFAGVLIAAFLPMNDFLRIALIFASLLPFMAAMCFALRIEQTAGYYECAHCRHRYVPTYKSVFFALHVNRTRYMRCPKCGQKSWQKKVLKKEGH